MNRKKRLITGFVLFLVFMWLCTVVSKSIYASRLAMVSAQKPEARYIEHVVEAQGMVEAGGKQAVIALGGVRVKEITAHVGDRVEEGDLLFTVDLEDLEEIMKESRTEIARVQLQIDTILSNEELARQQKALQEERAREDYDTLARYQDSLVGRAAEEVAKAEEAIEENGESQELLDALQAAAYAEADAKWNRDNTIKSAGRGVEDTTAKEQQDATLEVYQLELAALKEKLSHYQKLVAAEGKITAKQSGLITDIFIQVGGRVPDTASLLLTDDTLPYQFKVVLSKEEKKYVGLNDTVTLRLDGFSSKIDASVAYLAESSTSPGNFELIITLPEEMGIPGLSGTLSRSETGDRQSLCIPISALHAENNRTFVYLVSEREGILGQEYYVEEINVKVVDQNDDWAAIEGGLSSESRVITSSTDEIRKGDIVRYKE